MSWTISRVWSVDLWARWAVPAVAVPVLVASLAVAGRKPRKKEEGPAARLSEAPRSARSLRNPFGADAEAAAAGRKLFKQHCAECHGMDGRGLGHAADLQSPAIQDASAGSLFWAVRNGRIRNGMPSWSQLPDQQLWQLVTYLRTLKKKP